MADPQRDPVQMGEYLEFVTRRGFLTGSIAFGAGMLVAACGGAPVAQNTSASPVAQEAGTLPFGRRMKAAFSNAGLGATWCAQGKQAAEAWGRWMGVDVTWFDGALSIDKQRKAIDDMAAQADQWDFVAIQAFGIDTLVEPVRAIIAKGKPVIQMDTTISKDDIGITTFLEPDNIMMGSAVTETLVQKIGGRGNVIMTGGAVGHTGAQGRSAGFKQVIEKYPDVTVLAEDPADWDVNKVAKLWEDYLVRFPAGQINGAMFHNDDMALAAYNVIRNAGRDQEIPLVGVDAMPEALNAVADGRLLASVRNPSGRIHWGALVIGAMVASGQVQGDQVPKYILTDGPVVTPKNAPGQLFMQSQFLM